MTLVLDGPVEVGGVRIAVLARRESRGLRVGRAVLLSGRKTPLAILIAGDGELRAFRPDGRPLPASAAERLLPGTLRRLGRPGTPPQPEDRPTPRR